MRLRVTETNGTAPVASDAVALISFGIGEPFTTFYDIVCSKGILLQTTGASTDATLSFS